MSKFKLLMSLEMPDARVECPCGTTFVTGPWDNVTEIPYHGKVLLVTECPMCGLVDDPDDPPGVVQKFRMKG